MKKLLILLSILFSFSPSYAEQVISVLDVDKVITSSNSYKSFKSSWDADNAKYQKELEHYESKMIGLDKRIISESGRTNSRELEEMKRQLENYETTIQRLVEDRKNKLDSEFSQALYKIKTTLLDLVAKHAKDNGISVVLPKSQIIYTDNASDITDNVLEDLNAKLKTVSQYGR